MAGCGSKKRRTLTLHWQIDARFATEDNNLRAILSPTFRPRTIEGNTFHLTLYPKVAFDDGQLYLICCIRPDDKPLDFPIDCEWSFLDSNGLSLVCGTTRSSISKVINMFGCPYFEEVFGTRKSTFLCHDTFTIQCRIWRSGGILSNDEFISGKSQFGIMKESFLWPISEFSTLPLKRERTTHVTFESASRLNDFLLKFSLKGKSLENSSANVEVVTVSISEKVRVVLKLSILDNEQKVIKSVEHKFFGQKQKETWRVPELASRKELLIEKLNCLRDDITIFCEFTALFGFHHSIERKWCGISNLKAISSEKFPTFLETSSQTSKKIIFSDSSCQTLDQSTFSDASCYSSSHSIFSDASCQTSNQSTFSDTRFHTSDQPILSDSSFQTLDQSTFSDANCQTSNQSIFSDTSCQTSDQFIFSGISCQTLEQSFDSTDLSLQLSDSLVISEDLLSLYKDQRLTDFKLCSGEASFPVHKVVLSVRSPVFRSMFSSDLKESSSREVTDLDPDTLDQMLTFLYGGTVALDKSWEGVAKLYDAACKYQVQSLKHQCSILLKSHLSVSNVSAILPLTDAHEDKELMSFVHDFILSHFDEVILSEEWISLTRTNALLAWNSMQLLYKKKVSNQETMKTGNVVLN